MNSGASLNTEESIAIIGMDGRFPGAKNIEQFWENLKAGRESITQLTDDQLLASGVDKTVINDPNYVKAGAFLEDIDLFDANFFGYNPQEASALDPQHRIFLECAYSALENAGYNPDKYTGKIGIFAGVGWNNYLLFNLNPNEDFFKTALGYQTIIGNEKDFLTTRISYLLNLTGISIDIQTACSTSLVTTSMACQSLLTYQSDITLAGGISISNLKKTGYLYQEGGILSPDGHCRAFDAQAQGTVPGSGVGVVVLKRLEDALADGDCIHAVIRGSAINNDGAGKIGYTAPSIDGQAEVIAEALALAEVEPETISYVETHGTGTPLGDPIEIAALNQVFGVRKGNSRIALTECALGSVKTNIGHLDAAAGITGLIKTVLALKHKQIPPSLHFQQPNPKIDFTNSSFYVNTELREWKTPGYSRRAGVSSFGIGGTNVHVVLEEAPYLVGAIHESPLQKLLMISAKTESALDTATDNLVEHLQKHPELDLADVAYTLQVGRKEFNYRRMVVGQDVEDIAIALQSRNPQRVLTHCTQQERYSIVFMFPGQGSQYVNMGKELYETEPVFREWIDRCCQLLEPELGLDLRSLLYPIGAIRESPLPNSPLQQTEITQPALFVIEYALAQLWMSWGIKPQAAIGHSIGEYVAATLAGVMSLEDALHLVAQRGKLIQQMPPGSMLAVSLSEAEVRTIHELSLLNDELSLAASNAPNLCVISGNTEAIARLENQLNEQGIECRHLHTSHAFHSSMMNDAIAPFQQEVAKVKLNPPQMPFISCVTGTWITAEEATNPHYWAKHIRETVRFAAGVDRLLQNSHQILLEVGAGRTLSTLVRRNSSQATGQIVLSSLPHPKEQVSDHAFILNMLGRLWLAGVEIDWCNFSAHQKRRRVPLPTYPFERQRYWIDSKEAEAPRSKGVEENIAKKVNLSDWFYVPAWKSVPLIQTNDLSKESYLIFVDSSGIGKQLVEQLRQNGTEVSTVYCGDKFSQHDHNYKINPTNPEDYHSLLKAISLTSNLPTKIIHLWSLSPHLPYNQSFYSLIYLAQALEQQQPKHKIKIVVGTNSLYDIIGNETLFYEQATVLGALKVIPQEYTYLDCRQVDLVIPESEQNLITEFTTDTKDKIVAYRGNRRWVQTFEPIPLAKNTQEKSKLRQEGVYLITGGMGGVGLVLAEYLARTVQAKLILLGRSQLPSQETWDEWLSNHDAEDSISQKITKIRDLEALGAEVLTLTADICDRAQMQNAIAVALKRFGKINGVIHAAGVAGGGIIQLKTPEIAESVFAPKVTGTLVLNQVLAGIDLDFLVLCSSLSSVVGGFGQADYSGANAFLDVFARCNHSNCHTVAINWDAWQEVGMAVNTEIPPEMKQWQADNLKNGLLSAEAVEVFERALVSELAQVIVSTQDLATAIEQNNNFLATYTTQKPDSNYQHLSKNYVAPSNKIEKTIAKIWQEVIGFEKIGIHDNFFELGGHSLLAVQVTSRLREAFNLDLPLRTLLFEAPTIAQLADAIADQITPAADIDEMEQLLTEIENLSPEALKQELARES
ncbi:6-deoxyerythronolide-B synthase [Stanieria cyanosphaera PCC 7437]|uniref:Phenolphthiocerol/phthiocerol polyketide synthase subunit E n=1 Tax=Stanieria cyanosphaera (strain ATCC 29371 / PCC 7437) TaxID=111780 RepID=K9XVV6_STAC7|nr:type I polyketide synthase [Stanieria cyanosphaera]AFZ36199.1 6-deoxyerythronolide-B synthase [Stanieria cyanosphaera PCC 7437]